jgi:DNA replication licensing factor MCM6
LGALQEAEARIGQVNIRGDAELLPEQVLAELTEAEANDVMNMAENPNIYTDMARSMAPGVYGHEDIKRALLLMLLGGVHKKTTEACFFEIGWTTSPALKIEKRKSK